MDAAAVEALDGVPDLGHGVGIDADGIGRRLFADDLHIVEVVGDA
jgi:hypothetical protein